MEKMPYLSAMATLEQLQTLLIEDLGEGIDALRTLSQGTRLENDLILLAARYNSYRKKLRSGLLDDRQASLEETRLQHTAIEYIAELVKQVPERITQFQVGAAESPPSESAPPQSGARTEIHYHGSVYQNSPITIHQYQDFRQEVVAHQPHLQALGEAELAENLITREEYDELIEILQEIQQEDPPSDAQLPRWRRVLGKIAEHGRKFVGGRLERGSDAILGEAAKGWIKDGGLDLLMKWLG